MKSLSILLLLASCASAQIPAIDWDKNKAEILQHYRALVQIDSTAGNETRGGRLSEEGSRGRRHPDEDFALDPERANLVAR